MNFRLGCAVWSYKGWVGDFFPAGSQPSQFLRLYSKRLTAVEGNTTFYAVPSLQTVSQWAAETPAYFRFCPKLPRTLTHQGQLRSVLPEAVSFVKRMQALGTRLGPIFAQLPPSYGPVHLEDLTAFLKAWPSQEAALALEVRHPDWFQDPYAQRLNALLEQQGISRVLLDTRPIYSGPDDPQAHSRRRKPQLPLQAKLTASFGIIRFISHPQRERNQPFMDEWVRHIDQWLQQGKHIYFFVHCPIEDFSPRTAHAFQQQLEQYGTPVAPLPWDAIDQPPTQLALF